MVVWYQKGRPSLVRNNGACGSLSFHAKFFDFFAWKRWIWLATTTVVHKGIVSDCILFSSHNFFGLLCCTIWIISWSQFFVFEFFSKWVYTSVSKMYCSFFLSHLWFDTVIAKYFFLSWQHYCLNFSQECSTFLITYLATCSKTVNILAKVQKK